MTLCWKDHSNYFLCFPLVDYMCICIYKKRSYVFFHLLRLHSLGEGRTDINKLCWKYTSIHSISLHLELKSVVNYFHFLNASSSLSFCCRNGLSKQMKQVSFVDGLSDDAQVSREERSFRLWINSIGISTYINNVFEDLRNG